MKSVVISTLLATLVLLVTFQNCQKPPHADEINNTATLDSSVDTKTDFSKESVVSVNLFIKDTRVVNRAGNNYQVNFEKKLQIDLVTSEVVETNDLDSINNKYCLTDELTSELVSIIKASQVCETIRKNLEDTFCAQAIKPAYAEIITKRETIGLGYSTSSCGNSIDLCDAQPSILKAYAVALNSQYASQKCPAAY